MNSIPFFSPQSLRILLFEDNPLDAALVKKFLLTAGVSSENIHHVDTIPSAIQMMCRDRIDVCLADYYLRPNTGFDLMDEARRNDIDVPFIMLTAMDDRTVDEGALARGAYDFLVKGDLTVEGLERSIRYAMARHMRESVLARDALLDGLTGLPNRRAFYERVTECLAHNAGRNGMVSVAVVNLNGTKFMNESFGSRVGDEILNALGTRLQKIKSASDFVARIGGDEFGILMTGLVLPTHAVDHAKTLIDNLAAPVKAHDGSHEITVAAGVSSVTASQMAFGEAADRLIQHATQAMLNAKSTCRMHGTSEVAVARL